MATDHSSLRNFAPLTAAEEDLLCGREAEVEKAVENCRAERLTIINSTAGSGASSLILAGAEPALRRAGFATVYFADWQGRNVAARIREAIAAAVGEQADNLAGPRDSLLHLLKQVEAKAEKPVAVFLDQFEDYLLCHAGTNVSDDFDAQLSHAISSRAARFVIAIHPAAVPELERLSQFVPNLLGYTLALPPLDTEAVKDAARRIAARAGLQIEAAAVEEIAKADPALAILAARCLRDAELQARSPAARLSTLRENGGAERMALRSLDETIGRLRPSHRRLLLQWAPALVSVDRHRLAASQNTLAERSGLSADAVREPLDALIGAGLLRRIDTTRGMRFQLPRDSMAPVIRDWWTRTTAQKAALRQTLFRAVSVLVGTIAIVALFLVYFAKR